MSHLNRADNFAGRVNYAARVIIEGRTPTRAFCDCFENDDGDAVAAALVRRAERNPRLAANLWRYLSKDSAAAAARDLAGKNLAKEAAAARARARAQYRVTGAMSHAEA